MWLASLRVEVIPIGEGEVMGEESLFTLTATAICTSFLVPDEEHGTDDLQAGELRIDRSRIDQALTDKNSDDDEQMPTHS